MRQTTAESFWAHAARTGPCLEWQLGRSTDGYGLVRYKGDTWPAHRLAWFFAHGPIPKGLLVCHTCDNPPCIEPLHLYLGTHADNQRDARLKGRNAARLTEVQVVELRRLASLGVTQRALSQRFGVSNQTVSKIVNRRKWANLP